MLVRLMSDWIPPCTFPWSSGGTTPATMLWIRGSPPRRAIDPKTIECRGSIQLAAGQPGPDTVITATTS